MSTLRPLCSLKRPYDMWPRDSFHPVFSGGAAARRAAVRVVGGIVRTGGRNWRKWRLQIIRGHLPSPCRNAAHHAQQPRAPGPHYKLTGAAASNYGLQYREGRVTDVMPWRSIGSYTALTLAAVLASASASV